jgi:cell division septation protein DedD
MVEKAVVITLTGDNLGECIRSVSGLGLATTSTEQLVEELRRRLRPQGYAVNIDPAENAVEEDALDPKSNGSAGTAAAAPDKPKRGRPAKPKPTTEQAATPSVEPETETETETAEVTREQVVAALSAYAETHGGQVAARQVMQEVAKVTRLVDVKPADYAKLVARLTR